MIEIKKQTGGSAHPYRLGDFRGYDHRAQSPFISGLPNVVDVINTTMFMDSAYKIPRIVYDALVKDLNIDGSEYILVTDNFNYETGGRPHRIYAYNTLYAAVQSMADLRLIFEGLPKYIDEKVNYELHYGIWKLSTSDINPNLNDIENYEYVCELGDGTEKDGSIKNILFKGTQERPIPSIKMNIYVDPMYQNYISFQDPHYDRIGTSSEMHITIYDLEIGTGGVQLGYLPNGRPSSFIFITDIMPNFYQIWSFSTHIFPYETTEFELRVS